MGEANSLIVVAPDSLWKRVEDATYEALEPTLFTTRREKIFNVTHVGTESPELGQLLLWRQVIIFATPEDERLRRVARAADRDQVDPPQILQAKDVWALGQVATAVALEPGREAQSWLEQLPALAALLDRELREYVVTKMFVSGDDTATAAALRERWGVTLSVPRVYETGFRDGEIFVLRNDNPDPSELIRSILIQRLPAADSVSGEDVYAWRESIDDDQYNVPQSFERSAEPTRRLRIHGFDAVEVRGIWKDEGTFPAAGPFIGRAVRCPTGTFFFDAWLYSPNPRRSKFEYLLQLETILDSFRCEET
jgi:hypothetical protein